MTEFLYKFACFECKVSFKRNATNDTVSGTAHLAESEVVHMCPNCGHRMAFMGRNFAAPKKSDSSAWQAAKGLWEAGFRYSGNGYHSDPALPKSKAQVELFISENPTHVQKIGIQQQWENYA